MSLHISGINYESFADAEGVSCVIFFSGCRHNCVGCHSPQTHDFNNGELVTDQLIKKINIEIDKRPYLSCLVLSGGDPMYSAKEILDILPKLHIPNDTIWCFSGFELEQILKNKYMNELLQHCNVLIDGMFEIDKRDITLKFRGSSNQHIYKKGVDY
jgi:anaerobic ribonucleoside-triphosphate reductase activating protein